MAYCHHRIISRYDRYSEWHCAAFSRLGVAWLPFDQCVYKLQERGCSFMLWCNLHLSYQEGVTERPSILFLCALCDPLMTVTINRPLPHSQSAHISQVLISVSMTNAQLEQQVCQVSGISRSNESFVKVNRALISRWLAWVLNIHSRSRI
jgi:hypothetical protein